MKCVCGVIVVMAALLVSAPASAQQAGAWYAGVNTGASIADKTAATFGVEAGVRVKSNLDVVAEFFWTPNGATSGQVDNIGQLTDVLASYGSASGSFEMPVAYTGAGLRWAFSSDDDGGVCPYIIGTLGVARTDLQPTFTLDGVDVTDSMADYGVTLGEDVIGTYSRFGFGGGAGIVIRSGAWYVDAGVRLLSIAAPDQQINITRVVIGGGFRF